MAESQTFYVSYAPAMEVLQHRGNPLAVSQMQSWSLCTSRTPIHLITVTLQTQIQKSLQGSRRGSSYLIKKKYILILTRTKFLNLIGYHQP